MQIYKAAHSSLSDEMVEMQQKYLDVICVKTSQDGTPERVRDLLCAARARPAIGQEERRGRDCPVDALEKGRFISCPKNRVNQH